MPWNWNTAVKGPVAQWVIEFIEKLHVRSSLNYTLSGWWFMPGLPTSPPCAPPLRTPANMMEGTEMWAALLSDWKSRFGFDRLVYVDLANETPYFSLIWTNDSRSWKEWALTRLVPSPLPKTAFLADEINKPLGLLRREFPELRFTTSIHGDLRWLDVPLELGCLDVHFYADADPAGPIGAASTTLWLTGYFKTIVGLPSIRSAVEKRQPRLLLCCV